MTWSHSCYSNKRYPPGGQRLHFLRYRSLGSNAMPPPSHGLIDVGWMHKWMNEWINGWFLFPPPKTSLKYKHYPCFMAHLKWHPPQSLPWRSLWERAFPPSLHHSICSNDIIPCIEFTYIYHSPRITVPRRERWNVWSFILLLSPILKAILWITCVCLHVTCMYVHMHALEIVYSSLLNPYSPSLSISCNLGALRFR